jgi:flagellar biosynthesis protein FlhF
MNVKRFSARTSRDALNLVRQAFGEDAVVLSPPLPRGVEMLAPGREGEPHREGRQACASEVRAPWRPGPAAPDPDGR